MKIRAYKHPDIPHCEWEGEVLEQTDDYIVIKGAAGRRFTHHTKGKSFKMDRPSIEIFFFKEWYNVSFTFENDEVVKHYCNIAMPSVITDEGVCYVDLDLDVVKNGESRWRVVDRDEFESHQVTYKYGEKLVWQAEEALKELQIKIKEKHFPFDGSVLERYAK
jgi:protein associated with RNAse G/E